MAPLFINAASVSSHPISLSSSTSLSPISERKRHAPIDGESGDSQGKPRPRKSPTRTRAPSPPASPASRDPPQLALPEQASIHAILRRHCGTRLFVKPIVWTSQHLQLLDCRFETREIPQGPRSLDLEGHPDPLWTREMVENLSNMWHSSRSETRCRWIKNVLEGHGLVRLPSDKLQFHFGRRSVCHVRTDGVFSSEPGFPCLAYSDLESIQSMRRSHIDRPPSSRFDVSMARVRSKKLRRVTPPNELEDPYMAATIIALA